MAATASMRPDVLASISAAPFLAASVDLATAELEALVAAAPTLLAAVVVVAGAETGADALPVVVGCAVAEE